MVGKRLCGTVPLCREWGWRCHSIKVEQSFRTRTENCVILCRFTRYLNAMINSVLVCQYFRPVTLESDTEQPIILKLSKKKFKIWSTVSPKTITLEQDAAAWSLSSNPHCGDDLITLAGYLRISEKPNCSTQQYALWSAVLVKMGCPSMQVTK